MAEVRIERVPFCDCTNEELEAGRSCEHPDCPNWHRNATGMEWRVVREADLMVVSNALPSMGVAQDFIRTRFGSDTAGYTALLITPDVALVWRDGVGNEIAPERVDLLGDHRLYADLRDTADRAH